MSAWQGSEKEARYPSLAGSPVFITGGASGIGAALVAAFARQGARVAFVDIDEQAGRTLADALAAQHVSVLPLCCDVSDIAALTRAIATGAAALGDFHILVNNVANDRRHRLEDVTPEDWDRIMHINARPAYFAIQAVVPGMRRQGGGAIINVGSGGWQNKDGSYPCYAMAKAAVHGLTRGLAAPLGEHHIRINTLTPSWTLTERNRKQFSNDQVRALTALQCLPSPLVPESIAAMALFLASDDGRLCTAQEYRVDAGRI